MKTGGTAAFVLRAVLGLACALGLWQAVVWGAGLPRYILPAPVGVVRALLDHAALIGGQARFTLLNLLVGLAAGLALGLGTALHLALSPVARRLLRPMLIGAQAVPIFALAPILTLWLGFGIAPKIAMTVLIVFFPVATAFLDGLARTPQAALDLAQVMGASRIRVMRHLRIPAALPQLATGLRLAAVYAPIGAVVGEWVGGARGLGAMMLHANGRMKTDLVFAALLVLSLMTVLLAWAVGQATARLWRRYGA